MVALQWMVLHFENSFVTLAIAEENSKRELVVDTLPPFGGMRRISSKDRLKMLSPNSTYSSDTTDGFGSDKMKRVSSVSSISTLGKSTLRSILIRKSGSVVDNRPLLFHLASQEVIGSS